MIEIIVIIVLITLLIIALQKIKLLKFRISNTLQYIENEKHLSKEHLKDILSGEFD